MNTNLVKGLLVFLAGASIGAITATIIVKNKYDGIIEDVVREELESIRNARRASSEATKAEEEVTAGRDRKIDGHTEDGKILVMNRDRYHRIAKRYNGDTEISNAIADPEDLVAPARDEEEEYHEFERRSQEANRIARTEPYVITLQDFTEDRNDFDKITIYYYEDDDTLADENEEIISDYISIVGRHALDRFGDGSEDAEVVYVRNERISTDYEVIRLSKSYKETVYDN